MTYLPCHWPRAVGRRDGIGWGRGMVWMEMLVAFGGKGKLSRHTQSEDPNFTSHCYECNCYDCTRWVRYN